MTQQSSYGVRVAMRFEGSASEKRFEVAICRSYVEISQFATAQAAV